jgi:hypothetical protein
MNKLNRRSARRLLAASAVSLVTLSTLTSCSSKANDSSTSTEASKDEVVVATEALAGMAGMPGTEAMPAMPATEATEAAASVEFSAKNGALASDSAGSAVLPDLGISGTYAPIGSAQIKRAEVTIAIPTAEFNASVAQLTSLPGAVGGFITSSSFGGGEEILSGTPSSVPAQRTPRTGVVVMRVPSNEFDGVRERLPSFGTTISEQISGEEVSAQLVDLNARLTSLRLQEDSYRKLFEAAKQIQDIITVQERISEVRTQIEQIGAQRASLQNQVAMSTITVNVREKMVPTKDEPKVVVPAAKKSFGSKTGKAWKDGLNALTAFLTTLVVIVALLAPFIPFIALAGLLGWILVRRRRAHSVPTATTTRTEKVDTVRDPAPATSEREETLV